MFKKILMALVAVVATAAFVPSMASATVVPALHSGDTQAYLLDSSGNPITSTTSVTLTGRFTLVGAATVACDLHLTVQVHTDGTTTVTAPTSFTNCTVNIPHCDVAVAPNLNWGDRIVLDSNGDFRDRINVSLTATYSTTGCPYGPITYTGELSPILAFGGTGKLKTVFDSTAGSLTSALGGATASGTIEEPAAGGYGLGI